MKELKNIFKVLFVLIAFIALVSCNNDNKKKGKTADRSKNVTAPKLDQRTGSIKIDGDDITYNLVNELGIDFSRLYPNIDISINFSNTVNAINRLKEGEIDFVMTSLPKEEIEKTGLSYLPLASDVLVLISNFNNVELQTLAMRGISKESLSQLLTGKINKWKQVHPRVENIDPLLTYIPHKYSGTTTQLSKIFSIKEENINASFEKDEREIINNVLNSPISIGLVSHTLAYDQRSRVRRTGLYVLGIDINNNKTLDNDELIFDDLTTLKDGVKHGTIHNEFVREHVLLYNPEHKNIEIIKLFIEHIKPQIEDRATKSGFFKSNIN